MALFNQFGQQVDVDVVNVYSINIALHQNVKSCDKSKEAHKAKNKVLRKFETEDFQRIFS
ncbi:MAG: hypothetical protein ACI8YQ_003506, partial [Polaribacter sp.]